MTMNYNLGSVDVKPLLSRQGTNPIKTDVEWVSHGNYALCQKKKDNEDSEGFFPYIWIEMEEEYFDQILKAIDDKPLPTKPEEFFKPFWEAVLPARGMHFYETRTYFISGDRKNFVLHSQSNNPFYGYGSPSKYIDEMAFTVDDFKKIKDVVLNSNTEKPVHYCSLKVV